MGKYCIALLIICLSVLTGCKSNAGDKDSETHYYYIVVRDLTDTNLERSIVLSKTIEAPNDSAAIDSALVKIHARLYVETLLALQPNSHDKITPHDFIINIFGESGFINISSNPDLLAYVNKGKLPRIFEHSEMWNKNDDYAAALQYYKEQTSLFSNPAQMFERGKEYRGIHEDAFRPYERINDRSKIKSIKKKKQEKGMPLLEITILCVSAILLLYFGLRKPRKSATNKIIKPDYSNHRNKPAIKMLNREGDPGKDEWHTYIAGVAHYISQHDIGGFSGFVVTDHNNKYDSNAMGIYNSFGKLLGYIPAKELSDYREWCEGKAQPCVGFIFIEDNQIRGRVKILHPCNKEFMQTEFSRYLQWVNDNYGSEYLPKSMTMDFETL